MRTQFETIARGVLLVGIYTLAGVSAPAFADELNQSSPQSPPGYQPTSRADFLAAEGESSEAVQQTSARKTASGDVFDNPAFEDTQQKTMRRADSLVTRVQQELESAHQAPRSAEYVRRAERVFTNFGSKFEENRQQGGLAERDLHYVLEHAREGKNPPPSE